MTIFSYLREKLHAAPLPADDEGQAVERAVALTDPLLRAVPGYQHRLEAAVARALAHCEALLAALPGPIDIQSRTFASDPLVHALFPAVDDIGATLGRSGAVREFLAAPTPDDGESFYALLGVRRHEKNVMGMALWGDLVRGDSPQVLLYFSDHTLFGLANDLAQTRLQLRAAAFDSLVHGFVDGLGEGRQLLAEDKLAALADWLAEAETHLKLEPVTITVDLLGVESEAGMPGSHQLQLSELTGRDRRRWSVVLGRFSRVEAQEAVTRQEHAHRYMVI